MLNYRTRTTPIPIIIFIILWSLLSSCSRPIVRDELKEYPIPKEPSLSHSPPGMETDIMGQTLLSDISTLNPLVSEDASSGSIIGLFIGGLTSRNPTTGEMEPSLAKSWDISEDNLSYTFHIREGLIWSDGHPFSADDVLFTFSTIYDDRFPNRSKYFLMIDGEECKVEKLDTLTVKITTPKIYAPFLLFGGGTGILPKHKLEKYVKDGTLLKQWNISVAKNTPEELVGTGPFLVESYRPGERIIMRRNPNYYAIDEDKNRLPYIRRIIFKFVKDANASMIAFFEGKTDTESIKPDDVAWIKKGEKIHDFTIHNRGPSTQTGFVWFNQNPGKDKNGKPFVEPYKLSWFKNKEFRQAISYGINRQGIIDGILFKLGQPLYSNESPANTFWHNPNIKAYDYNPDKSRELLTKHGFKLNGKNQLIDSEGNRVQFTLMTNKENNTRSEISIVFKENMAELGIEVILKLIDFNTLVTKISESFNYECSLLGLTSGAPDPSSGFDTISSGGRMHMWHPSQKEPATKWEARLDELMNLQLCTIDINKRREYYNEVQVIMNEQQPFIYLVTPESFEGLKNKWQNIDMPKMGSILWNLEEIWAISQ